MIDSITGIVQSTKTQQVIISLGPVALAFAVPHITTAQKNQSLTLYTYLHWSQENGPSLFGFFTELERTVFELFISCSGVGPRLGLAAIADLGAESLLLAINTKNEHALSGISGIGKKKAAQIIMSLQDKVTKLLESGITLTTNAQDKNWLTLMEALKSLNYSRTEITQAVDHVKNREHASAPSFDQMMKFALLFLSKK